MHMIERGERVAQVDDYFLLDFDRVLGNTPNLFELLLETARESGSEEIADQLKQAYGEATTNTSSLSVARFLQENSDNPDLLDEIKEDFLKNAWEGYSDLTMPGTGDFIDYLSRKGVPYGILSFGDPKWQEMKIAAAGLDNIPQMIVDTKHKAKVAAEWFDGSDFIIPRQLTPSSVGNIALKAEHVVVVDDKLDAFKDMGVQMRGYLVNPNTSLPQEVEKVTSLNLGERLVATQNLTGVIAVEESFRRLFGRQTILTE